MQIYNFCNALSLKQHLFAYRIPSQNILFYKRLITNLWYYKPSLRFKISKVYETRPEAEFKEFEPRLKFKTWFRYDWFHLKLYSALRDLSRRSIGTGFMAVQWRGFNSINSASGCKSPWIINLKIMLFQNCNLKKFCDKSHVLDKQNRVG